MSLGPVRVEGAGEGEATSYEGEIMSLILARAYAPGSPLPFVLRLGDSELSLDGKTVSSKRRADGRFDVRVRLVSLRKEDREKLRASATPKAP